MVSRVGFRWVLGATALGAFAAATIDLFYPFSGDQALFELYARMMEQGAVLYRDVWDAKQPGIFWFYSAAIALPGSGSMSVHFLGALWLIANSALLAVMVRPRLKRPALAGLLPLAAAIFFIAADESELSQVEILMSPLLLWVVVLLSHPRVSRFQMLCAGAITGLLALFKLVAVVAPLAVFVAWLVIGLRDRTTSKVWARSGWYGAGMAGALLAAGAWVSVNGVWDIASWTWFTAPFEALGAAPRPLGRLLRSIALFVAAFALPVGLNLLYLARRNKEPSRMGLLTVVAIFAGLAVILAQFWWDYLFHFLAFPVVMLAIIEADHRIKNSPSRLGLALAALALVPFGWLAAAKAMDAVVLAREGPEEFRMSFPDYAAAVDSAASGPRNAADIYVLGDPLLYLAKDADQSIAVNGWSPEQWSPVLWESVSDDLEDPGTDAVFVASWAEDLAEERAPAFMGELLEEYRVFDRSQFGLWLVPR